MLQVYPLTGETDEYIAVLKFKVKAIPTDAKKVIYFPDDTLLANIERFTIALGTRGESATYSADVAEVNIKSIMSLDDSNLDIFPAGAATRTGISVKSGTMASTQFVGDVFKPGVTMQYDLSDENMKILIQVILLHISMVQQVLQQQTIQA